MAKTFRCVLKRHLYEDSCVISAKYRSITVVSIWFCWSDFAAVCPNLNKGLKPGQSRNLILKQTKHGISLSRSTVGLKPRDK